MHLWELPRSEWRERARTYEDAGFSTITLTDHLVVPQWDPLAGAAAIAAVTEHVRVGPLVLDMGLRNPVLVAKAAATVENLAGGRRELGLGAGYVAANFSASGVPFDAAADRVGRLEESVSLMRQLWTKESTSFHGRYFDVVDSPMSAADPVEPRLLIGGGGRRVTRLGGRVADTVSMLPVQRSGEWSVADSLSDSTEERMVEKASWVRQGAQEAGREPEGIELHTMVAKVIVGADPGAAVEREMAEQGIRRSQMADSVLYLVGTGPAVRDELRRWRDRIGISYVSFFDPGGEQAEYLAEHVVAPLAGQ